MSERSNDTDRPVLVAADFSDAASTAIAMAHEVAVSEGAPLVAIHVLPRPIAMHALFTHLNRRDVQDLLGAQRDLGDRLGGAVREVTGRHLDEFRVFVDNGEPYVEIVRRAEALNARMIVIGASGANAVERALLGSVSGRVLHSAHCPVLVSKAPLRADGPILAATDLSDPAIPALLEGARWSERFGAPLIALHVVDVMPVPGSVGLAPLGSVPLVPSNEEVAAVCDAASQALATQLERHGIEAEVRVREGTAASTIVEAAEEAGARLVVLGARGSTRLARLTLGSVADSVVRRAGCSLVTVRTPDS